jgi:hypothetical protein
MTPIARIVAHGGMLLFCVVLAAAVFVESLRQYLSARYGYASAPAATAARRANAARESVPLALTMGQKIA